MLKTKLIINMIRRLPRTIVFFAVTVLSASCSNRPTLEGCYSGHMQQDSIFLQLTQHKENISGTLQYNFFEKDKNSGDINGQIVNDSLLLLNYQFDAEGQTSSRQVAFIIDGTVLKEAHGAMTERDDGLYFIDITRLKQDHAFTLSKTKCK